MNMLRFNKCDCEEFMFLKLKFGRTRHFERKKNKSKSYTGAHSEK